MWIFSWYPLSDWGVSLSFLIFREFLSWMIIIFWHFFPLASIGKMIQFFFFYSVNIINFIDLYSIMKPALSVLAMVIITTWLWCIIFFMYCWTQFNNILQGILVYSWEVSVCSFLFLFSWEYLYQVLISQLRWLIKWVGKWLPLPYFWREFVRDSCNYFLKILDRVH